MKKTLKVLLATATISIMATVPAFAAEWMVDPSGYTAGVYSPEWQEAETKAQMEKWVNERKDAIIALPTQREKVDACIQAVCDHYTYDLRSDNVHPYYAYTTGYGVCKDYARDFHALLDSVGVENNVVTGRLNGIQHDWNYAVVDGVGYYFDLTGVDSTTIPDHYKYRTTMDSQYTEAVVRDTLSCYGDIYKEDGGSRENTYAWPEGMVPVTGIDGTVIYCLEEDVNAWVAGTLSTEYMMNKYPGF